VAISRKFPFVDITSFSFGCQGLAVAARDEAIADRAV
jgi:hypothetical protein